MAAEPVAPLDTVCFSAENSPVPRIWCKEMLLLRPRNGVVFSNNRRKQLDESRKLEVGHASHSDGPNADRYKKVPPAVLTTPRGPGRS